MPSFIVLGKSNGGVVHLNVDHIAAIYTDGDPSEPGAAVVLAGGGEPYRVKESAQEVRDKIKQLAAAPAIASALRGQ